MKRLLFVCVENSCRSQLAEAFGHIHKRDDVEIYSAGSRPSGQVNPTAVQVMAELDYDLSVHSSKSLQQVPEVYYDGVVTMGCGDNCGGLSCGLREDWPLPDPKHLPLAEFRKIRNQIEGRVVDLLERL